MQQKSPVTARAVVFHYAVAVLCLAGAGGCRPLPPAPDQLRHTIRTIGCERDSCGSAENQIEVTYLGTSGLLIRYRGAALLTAPFFSNPVLKRVALSMIPLGRNSFPMLPDTALIQCFLHQDAPSSPPYGFPANSSLEQRSIDLAVICAATSTYLDYVPESLLKALAPRNMMVTHWESLFRRGTLSVHFNAAWDVDDFVRADHPWTAAGL